MTALHVVARREPLRFAEDPIRLTVAWLDGDVWMNETVDAEVVEGRHDVAHDFVFVSFKPPPKTAILSLRSVDEDSISGSRTEWRTWGFADANPDEGAPFTGHVQTTQGDQGGVRALALYSREAGAGRGEPI